MHPLTQDHRNFNETELLKTSDNHLSKGQKLNHVYAAALSGALARIVTQPFDVLKVRFQLQVKPVNQALLTSTYHNIPQAIKTIYHQEGITALWKGHAPGQLLSILYGISQFYTFEELNILAQDIKFFKNHPNVQHFFCGSICGAFASFVTAPMDTIKTRLIAQDKFSKTIYKNAQDAFVKTIQSEGPSGLYRGLTCGIYQIVPYMGWNFMCYNLFGQIVANLMEYEERNDLPAWCLLVSGGLSGIISKTIVYPFDVIQMRLQIQGCALHKQKFGTEYKCRGVWNCLFSIIRFEGYRKLFTGIKPSIIKACLTSSIHFCFYDKIFSYLK